MKDWYIEFVGMVRVNQLLVWWYDQYGQFEKMLATRLEKQNNVVLLRIISAGIDLKLIGWERRRNCG